MAFLVSVTFACSQSAPNMWLNLVVCNFRGKPGFWNNSWCFLFTAFREDAACWLPTMHTWTKCLVSLQEPVLQYVVYSKPVLIPIVKILSNTSFELWGKWCGGITIPPFVWKQSQDGCLNPNVQCCLDYCFACMRHMHIL